MTNYLTDTELRFLRNVDKLDSTNTNNYELNKDLNPHIVHLNLNRQVNLIRKLVVQYLRPPTPPSPGPIVITIKRNKFQAPPPPLIIRQQPARQRTPDPLVIRELPPKKPSIKSISFTLALFFYTIPR